MHNFFPDDPKNKPATEEDNNDTSSTPPTSPASDEKGGPKGPEPTRYGDWERGGRCIDF